MPLDREFRCKGGPHHPHNRFQKIMTMEYKPNSLFAFVKTDNSFHGVDPIQDEHVQRDILLYDVRVFDSRDRSQAKNNAPQNKPNRTSPTILQRLFGNKQR